MNSYIYTWSSNEETYESIYLYVVPTRKRERERDRDIEYVLFLCVSVWSKISELNPTIQNITILN